MWLQAAKFLAGVGMGGEIEIDVDENGKVIGIEFVNASLK